MRQSPEIAQRNQRIVALRRNGVSSREIAERYGMKTTYVRTILSDPDGSKARARKERYRGTCRRCGGPTTGGDGRAKAPTTCASCFTSGQHERRYWTSERVIAAIKRFAVEHGRPPVATEWLYGIHGRNGDGYPHAVIVIREFGSWANGVEAAGFPRPRIGWKPRGMKARVSAETYIERLKAMSRDGIAPSLDDPFALTIARGLRRRGLTWAEACKRAGVKSRHQARWERHRAERSSRVAQR
jgi:hypothetical protein